MRLHKPGRSTTPHFPVKSHCCTVHSTSATPHIYLNGILQKLRQPQQRMPFYRRNVIEQTYGALEVTKFAILVSTSLHSGD